MNWTSWRADHTAVARPLRYAARTRLATAAILLLALVQGLLYLVLIPPWQHYDEPTHFEYAWLIAHRGRLPQPNEVDQGMRREVAASMVEHDFYRNLPQPDLLTETGVIEIGFSELGHPPAYYLLASVPLRMAGFLDVTTQLYIARLVSVALFVLTIGVALALMRELTPANHVLRWAVPLLLLLLPPFADIMTAVNNDAGAIFVFSLFLWLSVRAIRRGLHWRRVLLLTATAGLATFTKNTASLAVALLPLALLLAAWVQHGWHWRWLALSGGAAVALLLGSLLTWGDASAWYRQMGQHQQAAPTRIRLNGAPLGQHSLQLATSIDQPVSLLNPLLLPDVQRVAGRTVTVGAWVWADLPTTAVMLNLDASFPEAPSQPLKSWPITATTTPTFMAWTTRVPAEVIQLHLRLSAEPAPAGSAKWVYLDGALLAEGVFDTAAAPVFRNASGRDGAWAGQPFQNLVRNGSAEHAWPRLRVWIDQALVTYARRSPGLVVAALFDLQRTGGTLLLDVLPQILFSFFGALGWGHLRIPQEPALPLVQLVVGSAVLGCGMWLWRRRGRAAPRMLVALALLGTAGALVWGNVVLRVLPLLDGITIFAVARYGFPAALPAVLLIVGGWWALWPRRQRLPAVLVLLCGAVVLNAAAVWTAWSFYQSFPA